MIAIEFLAYWFAGESTAMEEDPDEGEDEIDVARVIAMTNRAGKKNRASDRGEIFCQFCQQVVDLFKKISYSAKRCA